MKTKKNKKNKKGFSLIELVIYMGLLAILLVVLAQVFTSIIQSRLDSESGASIDQDANYILTRLTYDVQRAQAINTPSNFVTGTQLQINVGGVNYTYALSGGNLQLTNSYGSNILNGYNSTISSLQVTRIGNGTTPVNTDSIKINFTITSRVRKLSGNESRNYEITVAPR